MSLEELKASLDASVIETLKTAVSATQPISDEDFNTVSNYLTSAADALGEDQITEPLRYICASIGGLRAEDLKAVIEDGFDADVFEQWNNLLGFPVLAYRDLGKAKLYDLQPVLRTRLREMWGEKSLRSCASDLGYYLLEERQAGDLVRDVQIMHLLLDGEEVAAAAEYLSQAEGEALRIAVNTVGQALKDGPDYVKQAVYDMPRTEGEKVNTAKLLMLLLNDCLNFVGQPDLQKPVAEKLTALVDELIRQGHQEITVLLGLGQLRLAQNARLRRDEQAAQQTFIGALNYLMAPLQQADPLTISAEQIRQYWICLKICQEMAQPKAISLLFESIIKVEKAITQDASRPDEERGRVAEDIIAQHIDMSKLYYAFPKELQEQFTNYTEPTLALLKAYLDGAKAEIPTEPGKDGYSMEDVAKLASYYQSAGELNEHLERLDESYDALVEAQILQMRLVGQLQTRDGEQMSPQQLLQRLALSVTNHMLAAHYRRQGKQHDLNVVLTANMNLALDCFKAYGRDGRVIHFTINAALELGDLQHRSGGMLAECGTYEKVIRQFGILNNMRIDAQLCQDLAMIHTKCGQAQSHPNIRRYGDALRNLDTALKLWSTMYQNTKNEEFKKNADVVAQQIAKFKKKP